MPASRRASTVSLTILFAANHVASFSLDPLLKTLNSATPSLVRVSMTLAE
jgi:hypothetical protein